MLVKEKKALRERRHRRIRKKIKGTAERPRLCVFRSLRHIYAQLVDDEQGYTLLGVSSLAPELRGLTGTKTEIARAVGALLGKKAVEKGIKTVVFDRGGYKYHGRVQALADGAREAGLVF
ncbi:MAG: 50S ribosomal protein L18 [Atribacterota bacterium]|nr:50S ribosomal protein L18 [Atribacterota bacterium]